MPSIIDSLVITLGLDPAKFISGQKDAEASMAKTKTAALKQSKELEEANKKFAESFNYIKVQAAELFAVIAGASSIKSFIADVTTATAALGRLSANISVSPQELGAWGLAIERIGGDAAEAAGDFQTLSQQLFDLRQNGKNIPESLQKMGAEARVPIDFSHGLPAYLHSLAAAASELTRLHGGDRSDSFNFLKQAGIGPGMATILIDNGAALDKYIGSLKNLAPTDDQIKKFEALQTAFVTIQEKLTAFGREIVTDFADPMAQVATAMGNFATANKAAFEGELLSDVRTLGSALTDIKNTLQATIELWNSWKPKSTLFDIPKALGATPNSGDKYDPLKALRGWLFPEAHADTLDDLTPGRGNSGPHPASGLFIQGQQVSRGNPMPVTIISVGGGSGDSNSFLGGPIGSGTPLSDFGPQNTPNAGGGGANPSPLRRRTTGGGAPGDSTILNIPGAGPGSEVGKNGGLREDNPADMQKINKYMAEAGVNYKAAVWEWCAGWVNAQLAHEGIKGSGSLMARSFFNYGKTESAKDAKVGDIMVRKDGSHVGRFAGWAKDGNPLFYSGNTGGGGFHRRGVDTHEENPGNFFFRRIPPAQTHAALSTMSALHPVTTSSTSNAMHVGDVHVHGVDSNNAHSVASRITDALRQSAMTTVANFGQA